MTTSFIYKDGTYLKNNPTWHEEGSAWKAKQVTKILKRNGIIPSRICDIGCGTGEVLNCLDKEYGDQVELYGYDISPQALEMSRTKEKHNIHFFLKDFTEVQPDNFDIVMEIDVFEHVEDYFGFLRKLKGLGTYKVLHIPLDLSARTVSNKLQLLDDRQRYGHLHYFTKETALATLKDTGYEVIDYFYTRYFLESPNPSLKENIFKVLLGFSYALNHEFTVKTFGCFELMVLAK
jgi:ubiquinone/menaquinone biosynthesis C-methylase UbiE